MSDALPVYIEIIENKHPYYGRRVRVVSEKAGDEPLFLIEIEDGLITVIPKRMARVLAENESKDDLVILNSTKAVFGPEEVLKLVEMVGKLRAVQG